MKNFGKRVGWLSLPFLLVGCGPGEYSASEIEGPKAELVAALEKWKAGAKLDAAQAPTFEIVDDDWKAGAKLRAYEILRAEAKRNENMRFWTKLTLERRGKTQEREVVFEINVTDPAKRKAARDAFN